MQTPKSKKPKTQKSKNPKNPNYVYIVYCNVEPIVYGVYSKKQDAVRYALNLIRFRQENADMHGYSFGFYHFQPYAHKWTLRAMSEPDTFEFYHDATIFTACLRIKPKDEKVESTTTLDDGCRIYVKRHRLN